MINLLKQRCYQYFLLMRFHKPIGIFLLLWPTLWALWLASHGRPNLTILIIFIAGVVLMRAAGCVINDVADRHFDRHIARTKNRPLTTGKISLIEALLLFACLSLLSFVMLLKLNYLTIALAFPAILLVISYPFSKRYITWPQFILGLAFGWGIPMAYAAQTGHLPVIAWLLFLSAIFWIIVYDTQYAMVDRDDDLKIGIKSTAILFGRHDVWIIGLLQTIFIALLILIGKLLSLNIWFYMGIIAATVLFIYQHFLIRHRQTENCFKAFLNNHWVGMVIFLGILLNYFF